jgi:multicomponent K+:H+ antiporter subunit F
MIAFAMFMIGAAMLLAVLRLMIGPTIEDRVLALDTLYVDAMALLVLMGIALDTRIYFETALVIAVLGFVATVAVAKYLRRGRVLS